MPKQSDLHDLGAAPINIEALRVCLPGVDWIPDIKPGDHLLFDVAPDLSSVERPKYGRWAPDDLTGRKLGRLTVVGWFGVRRNGRGEVVVQKWLCRCQCGSYCIRTAATIKKAKDPDDKCQACRHLSYLKRHDRFRQGLKE